jgi:hypothetical protein
VLDFSMDFTGELHQVRFLSAIGFNRDRVPSQTVTDIIVAPWQVKPVALTPEILQKCSFVKYGLQWKYRITLHEFNKNGNSFYYIDYEGSDIAIFYLHELQHVFFDLCRASGEELNVKI